MSGLSIIVADDSLLAQEIIGEMLKQYGITDVAAAMNGEELLSRVAVRRPDAVILDLVMPVMDGFQVLEAADGSQFPPIIISSSSDDDVLNAACAIAGRKGLRILGILRKPYGGKDLVKILIAQDLH